MRDFFKFFAVFLGIIIGLQTGFSQVRQDVRVAVFEKAVRKRKAQVLDVRTAEEFAAGHIARAHLADWKDSVAFIQQLQLLDKERPIYIYCRSGQRAGQATEWLLQQGYKNVVNLQGGFLAWEQARKKITHTRAGE